MNGLTSSEVKERIDKNLVNNTHVSPTKSYKEIIYTNIFTWFNMLNLLLGSLIITTGSIKNLTFLGVVFCNTIISLIREIKSKKIIDELAIISTSKVNVIRDKELTSININEIVVDDIIKLETGNQIVVDGKIVSGSIEVDESFLTGEADYILKNCNDELLSGSFVVSGSCYFRVTKVGDECYANKLSKEAKYFKRVFSEIMNTLNKVIKFISIAIVPIGIILFIKQMNISGDYVDSVTSSVAALIGMIPEGLVLLTSSVFAIASVRLARKNVLVQQLYCIESLARIDTICLDKTGTLTTGDMKVYKTINLDNSYDINEIMGNIVNVTLDNNATSKSLKEYFKKLDNYELVNIVPFSSLNKYSVFEFKDNTYILGALEFINTDDIDVSKYIDKYRVLFLGVNKEHIKNNKVSNRFKPVGLILVEDTLRENALSTIEYLKSEDVDIKIISGDNVVTVSNIVKKVGLKDVKIIDMSKYKGDISSIVLKYNVFGRVTPTQKKEIILALQKNGRRVAMTGDGVNDVLALKESDCSISFKSGSEAARGISEIVLLDDDFKSIPSIINEGRRSINNLERSASLFLTKTMYATMLAILFLFINNSYPFIPIQLTLISVITIGIPSFILALEPNTNRVKGRFLINVFKNSFPAALTIVINIISVMLVAYIFNISNTNISTMSVILVASTGFILLFKICYPFNYLRGILFGTLLGVFIGGSIGLHKLFELVLITPYQFIFILILCIIDCVIFNLLSLLVKRLMIKYESRLIK